MPRSLSLAAYRALSRHRFERPDGGPLPPRPEGELVWAHAADAGRLAALAELAGRIRTMRPGLQILITTEPGQMTGTEPSLSGFADCLMTLGSDHPGAAQRFLEHWRPDLCLWLGGRLMVNLLSAASDSGARMILADISEADFPNGRRKWFPALTRRTLDRFHTILADGLPTAQAIRRLGVAPAQVEATEPLRITAMPPNCADDDLTEVTNELSGRPVWLADRARADEIGTILAAHRAAIRLSHRLLLVITLNDPADEPKLIAELAASPLRFANWDDGERIEDGIQVLASPGGEDIGLWYRIAPLTLMANSLTPAATGLAPMPAAALGSALLCGPHQGAHAADYARLAAAGAARRVNDAETLGKALIELVAPDRAAKMALAGWELATEGAGLTDRIVDLVIEGLDDRKAAHARA